VKTKIKLSLVCSIVSKCVKFCFWKVLFKLASNLMLRMCTFVFESFCLKFQWNIGYGDGWEKSNEKDMKIIMNFDKNGD
jgi:hypothetical protein